MYLFNTDPKLEGSHEDKIDIVLELLKELKNEALAKRDEDYFRM